MDGLPAEEQAAGERPKRRKRRWLRIVILVVVLLFSAITARVFMWPDLDPLPDRADAIIELAGPGFRDDAALLLARDHRAPVLVQSTVESEVGTNRCLPPVSGVTIMCFHADQSSVRGQAQAIGELGARYGWKSVIIVTTPDYAWRTKLWVSRCFPGQVYVSTTPLPTQDWFFQVPHQWAASAKALIFDRGC